MPTTLMLTGVMLLATLTPLWAERAEPAEPADNATTEDETDIEGRLSELKKPQDFAPPERIVSGRDMMSFRKEGTLLSKTSREIPKVDPSALAERKYAMYGGRRFYRRPTPAASEAHSPRAAAVRRKLAAATAKVPEGGSFGWIGWTLLVVIVSAALVAWRMGWFVPFSLRAEAKKRASRAASEKRQSRQTKAPRIELVRRR